MSCICRNILESQIFGGEIVTLNHLFPAKLCTRFHARGDVRRLSRRLLDKQGVSLRASAHPHGAGADRAAPAQTGGLREGLSQFSDQHFPAVPGGHRPVAPARSQAAREGH